MEYNISGPISESVSLAISEISMMLYGFWTQSSSSSSSFILKKLFQYHNDLVSSSILLMRRLYGGLHDVAGEGHVQQQVSVQVFTNFVTATHIVFKLFISSSVLLLSESCLQELPSTLFDFNFRTEATTYISMIDPTVKADQSDVSASRNCH